MRTLRVFSTILSFMLCASPLAAEGVSIRIRLVNGKTARPITDENLNIFVDQSRFSKNIRADRNGLIKLTVDRGATISFASNIELPCHRQTNEELSAHKLQEYKVSDILEHGISDTNSCSKKIRVEPRPGEFVYFERPRTFWEWMMI